MRSLLKALAKINAVRFTEIEGILDKIRLTIEDYEPNADNFPMTGDQLRKLSDHDFFPLGSHPLTHPALSHHSKEIQNIEITGCKKYLENSFGKPILSIAYPYGSHNKGSENIIKTNNISIAFTSKKQTISHKSSPFAIGRFQPYTGKKPTLISICKNGFITA